MAISMKTWSYRARVNAGSNPRSATGLKKNSKALVSLRNPPLLFASTEKVQTLMFKIKKILIFT